MDNQAMEVRPLKQYSPGWVPPLQLTVLGIYPKKGQGDPGQQNKCLKDKGGPNTWHYVTTQCAAMEYGESPLY